MKIIARIFIIICVIWLAVLLVGGLLEHLINMPLTDWLREIHIWWWFYGSLAVGIFGEGLLRKASRDTSKVGGK